MRILGIETSCDETAISLIEVTEKENALHIEVLGNTLISQIELHAPYGGVFPVLAKREHGKNLVPVLIKTLEEAGVYKKLSTKEISKREQIKTVLEKENELFGFFDAHLFDTEKPVIDHIAVTSGPGLEPALWVGINFADALGKLWDIPVTPVNHMEGHLLVALLKAEETNLKHKLFSLPLPPFPALTLLISGGHTELVLAENLGNYKLIGQTRDDAVGECFDKVARTLGIPYPGGPEISRLADLARKEHIASPEKLPRPMINTHDFDFSFSGLKTSVLYLTQRLGIIDENTKKGIALETEKAITDVLVKKTESVLTHTGAQSLIVGGGVIANTHIREELATLTNKIGIPLFVPERKYSTDNALMIALCGYFSRIQNRTHPEIIKAEGNVVLSN